MALRKTDEFRVMDLDQALAAISAHHAFLHYDYERGLDLWSPHHKLPITLRRAIVKYRQTLLDLMSQGDVRVCPNPMLHKSCTRGKRICRVCKRLDVA